MATTSAGTRWVGVTVPARPAAHRLVSARTTDPQAPALDHRSVAWRPLLPAEATFVAQGTPPGVEALLPDQLHPTGNSYLGWGTSRAMMPSLERFRAVALVKPRGVAGADLQRAGFAHTRAYTALPSLADARWLISIDNRKVAVRSLDLIAPARPRDRAKKAALALAARTGLLGRVGDTVLLGCRAPNALLEDLSRLVGVPEVFVALRPGPKRVMRKTTLQVMTPSGDVRAFGKLAASPEARAVIEREIAWLRRLGDYRPLRGLVPELVSTFSSPEGFVSVQSAGPTRRGPSSFGAAHQAFLRALSDATCERRPCRTSEMWSDVGSKLRSLLHRLPNDWRGRLLRGWERVDAVLGPRDLPLTLAHRDFGPWNTRISADGRLFVFDWDVARTGMIPLYDLIGFHFLTRTAAVPGSPVRVAGEIIRAAVRWAPAVTPGADPDLTPDLLLAYLVESALGRLIGAMWRSDVAQDSVLLAAGALLDARSQWLPPASDNR